MLIDLAAAPAAFPALFTAVPPAIFVIRELRVRGVLNCDNAFAAMQPFVNTNVDADIKVDPVAIGNIFHLCNIP
jgi:hypothetical protein